MEILLSLENVETFFFGFESYGGVGFEEEPKNEIEQFENIWDYLLRVKWVEGP